MEKSKKVFITFGANGKNYIDAGNRLLQQAQSTELFDEAYFYTDIDLKNDTEFWSQHGEFIITNKRGYGYWLWKPYLINKTISSLKDGDILMYLDCGCEIDVRNKEKIKQFFEIVQTDYISGCLTTCHLPEKGWCKMDLLLRLNIFDETILNTQQRQAGAQLIYICDKTRKLISEWYSIVSSDYHMIDDSKSHAPNYPEFKEHRHDQSTFSLLTKKYDLFSSHYITKCIKYDRNKTGTSKLR